MADLGSRPSASQGSAGFTFANQPEPSREKQKNYVFVDEHNRHRRLKVMRACGACRRRKIKCDAATTNTWPCAACVKQNLECVPPSSENDGQDDGDDAVPRQTSFQAYQPAVYSNVPSYAMPQFSQAPAASHSGPYDYGLAMPADQAPLASPGTADGWPMQLPQQAMYPHGSMPEAYHAESTPTSSSHVTYANDTPDIPRGPSCKSETPDSELADALQDLRIDQAGVAPYIANQRTLAEGPAIEEAEAALPPMTSKSDRVSIPPEMMPSEQQANQYIDFFFANIHPYVPVINRSYFTQQWNRNKYSISPLILEGIFACSAHQLQQHEDRNRWLALASRHEESFKDVPRLSTIQGLTLLLKAREAIPRRGYYYRSWMTISYLIAMAKDLEIDEHNWAHIRGEPCGSEDFDCAVKCRVWHALFQNEMMIGGPQGRVEFSVDIDSVMTDPLQGFSGVDESELRISQDQIQMVRAVKNIRETASIYARLRKKVPNFAEDPAFIRHNTDYYNWMERLPRHLQISFEPDGSAPWIPFHFAANLHAYHLLGVILHHRPQLSVKSGNYDHAWKQIMMTCYSAATRTCRLHEAVIKRYGVNGLSCMVRGVNTAIYQILSCTVLHLVAITSPDTDLNSNAKDYFSRHMRVLEQCASMWPMESMQVQITSLREAFSADLSKPFELKASFPFNSPAPSDTSSPRSNKTMQPQQYTNQRWTGYDSGPLTPPGTASSTTIPSDYTLGQNYNETVPGYTAGPVSTQGGPSIDAAAHWDPSGVFDSWNAAFSASAASMETPSPGKSAMQATPGTTTVSTPATMYSTQNMSYANYPQQPMPSPRYPNHMQPQSDYVAQPPASSPGQGVPALGAAAQNFISPSMWQDAVARSYGDGLKRRWDDQSGSAYKRVR